MTPAFIVVLIVARVVVVWGRAVEWTPASIAAHIGQDALVALAFLVMEAAVRRWHWGRPTVAAVFWGLVVYVAVNVAVARVLPTPLTWPMLQAGGVPIADSIRLYVTATSLGLVTVVIVTAMVAVQLSRRVPRTWTLGIALGLLGTGLIGSAAVSRVDTWGRHRNALVTLAASALPVVDARPSDDDWRRPPFEAPSPVDLSALRGIAAGRNVVVIGLESTGAQYLRLYGASENVMPRLEALAAHALVFDGAYAVSPDSIRSLYSVLCSRYPAFDTAVLAYAAGPCGSLAKVLQANGYHTALMHSGRFGYLGMDGVIRDRGFATLEDAGHIGGNHESSFGVDEPAVVTRMLSWIDGLPAGERFALTYLPVAGHHPYQVSGKGAFGFATELDRYRSALHAGDAAFGTLLDGLKARGLFEQTLFVVYGDHGQAFGQHPGNIGHTFYLYEENVRVPLIVAAPGAIGTQVRSAATTSLVDVTPTVFDLLGLPGDPGHQGRSALTGPARLAMFFTDYASPLTGLRDGRWKFIHDLGTGQSRLFDLYDDPAEVRDRTGDEGLRVTAYTRKLKAWTSAQKGEFATAAVR